MLERDADGAATLGGLSIDELLEGRTEGQTAPIATPAYLYDLDAMADEARALIAGFGDAPHLVAYAVKANSAGPVIRALADAGCGAEVVTGGELALSLACGVSPDRILYSGVAKTNDEIDAAISAGPRGILALQMESVEEVARVAARASALGRKARVSIRFNPNIVADTHAHVATGHDEAKFGIASEDLAAAFEAIDASADITLVGMTTHVGSQLTATGDYLAAAKALLDVAEAREAQGGPLSFIDFGGGFGIDYGAGCPSKPADFARAAVLLLGASKLAGRTLVVEPGRSLVGAHGVLCASVIAAKRSRRVPENRAEPRRWVMIDAGMNDLLRPALYGALHRVEAVERAPASPGSGGEAYRVVGPICESSDDFGEHVFAMPLPRHVLLRDAGAYGFTMASQYNGRAMPSEIFLKDGRVRSISVGSSVSDWVRARSETKGT